jgi:mRNA interferase MazF
VGLKRGDIALVAPPGEFGKPRPALIIQAALPSENITYLPITSDLLRVPHVRIPIRPDPQNGLQLSSEIMVDMIQTSSLSKFRQVIGSVEPATMVLVEKSLSLHLGLDKD